MAAVDNLDRVIYNSCKLTDEQVYYVLTCTRTNRQLAVELGLSDTAIQRIRSGMAYKHVLPDVPRPKAGQGRKGPTCEECVHLHHGQCSMGFPEARYKNYRAAYNCAAFTTQPI